MQASYSKYVIQEHNSNRIKFTDKGISTWSSEFSQAGVDINSIKTIDQLMGAFQTCFDSRMIKMAKASSSFSDASSLSWQKFAN